MTIELEQGVYWVGVVDWAIRHFHGFELSTHRGTSYNAYLICDEKNVLVDTVGGPFQKTLLANIRQVMDPAKIDIVVVNHAETDHSGALPAIMRHCPNAKLIVSKNGATSVPGHYHADWPLHPVKTGDRIPIGKNELIFIEAPMLHWPDSMFTYLTGHNLLMSNDAFGQHYAAAHRFNDQVAQDELYQEARKYFVNILTPFCDRILKKIDEVLALKLPVDMIAPSHGIIWRKDPLQIVRHYQEWSQQKPEPRAVILYDTMWDATARMARMIGAGLAEAGVDNKIYHSATGDRNDILVEIARARMIVAGSPTLNNSIMPTLWPLLHDLKDLRFKNKIGAAFGSYGWSGESVRVIEEHFAAAKIPLARPGLRVKWQPGDQDLEACRVFGRELADAIRQDR